MKSIFPIGLAFLAMQLSVLPLTAQIGTNEDSFIPENPPELKPLASHHTPAYHAAKDFLRGANLGDYLEALPEHFGKGVTVSANDLAQMKREGFDHVRVPIGWHHYARPAPDYELSPEIFGRVDFIVTNALNDGLAVMINIHHFNKLDKDPAGGTDEFPRHLEADCGALPRFSEEAGL